MSSSAAARVAVVLVDLPKVYAGFLKAQFAQLGLEDTFIVEHLSPTATVISQVPDARAVIVVSTKPASLRRASSFQGPLVIGIVAVTDDAPKGDIYVVSPSGTNVGPARLAEVILDVTARTPFSSAAPLPTARYTRSDT